MPNKLYQKNKKYVSAYSIYHWFGAKSRNFVKKRKKRTNTPLLDVSALGKVMKTKDGKVIS